MNGSGNGAATKKEAAMLPGRPESREETPKEGICDKNLPHRNNIHSGLMKCKGFVRPSRGLAWRATFLPQPFRRADMSAKKIRMPNNGLVVSFFRTGFIIRQTDMAGMQIQHDNGRELTPRHGSRP